MARSNVIPFPHAYMVLDQSGSIPRRAPCSFGTLLGGFDPNEDVMGLVIKVTDELRDRREAKPELKIVFMDGE